VAALVILLVLALLIPPVLQALRGAASTGSGAQDTAEVDSSGDSADDEESATHEKTVSSATDVAQLEDAAGEQADSSETGGGDGVLSSGAESSEDVGTVENIEIAAKPAETEEVLEEEPVSEVDQTAAPLPVIDTGAQQAIQPIPSQEEPIVSAEPIAPVEPLVPLDAVAPVEPTVPAEPISFEDSIAPVEPVFYLQDPAYYDYYDYLAFYNYPAYYEDPAYYDYSAYYEDPAYYDYSAYYGDSAYYDYPAYYEEQTFEEPDTLDTGGTVALQAESTEHGGGSGGAYAAISAD